MDSTTRFRSRLGVQPLEDRSVPAASPLYISEVMFTPPSQSTQQYFEIRGTPGATIPAKTYMVLIDGDAAPAAGTINGVFDLGGIKLGSDGYLVVAQGGNPYTFTPTATVLAGTNGFFGLPGNRFTSVPGPANSNQFQFIFTNNTFMLVSARTAPVAGADVDQNDDGVLDSAASTWTVLDSVGVIGTFTGSAANQIGYGKVNFSNGGLGQFPTGSTVVKAEDYDHVARLGESTGSAATDWVADKITGSGPFTVDASIFGHSTQRILTGLPVSDQGTSNFVSEIYGQVYTDANGNGTFDAGDTPAAGQTVFLDQNGDGVPDDDTYTADPDGLSNGTALTNLYPELTLSTSNPNPVFDDASVQAQNIAPGSGAQPTTGSAVFGWGPGFNFWTNNTRLRGDFYRPADSVSIDFVATTISASIGRLDVYSADGTLLQTVTTAGLVSPASATLTITRPQADIAYFVAYPDASGFPFNYFDNLRYSIPEQTTTTDASGNYSFGLLQDGTYTVRTVGQQRTATIAGLVPARHVDFPTTGTGGGGGGGGGTTTGGTGRTVAIGGGPGSISLYSAGDGQLNSTGLSNFPILFQGAPFDGTYRTATGDVNGDGIEDTVVVTGPGVPVQFAVIDGKTNSLLVPPTTAFAGSNDFTGGGFVSVGDLDGDGKAEIVLTPDQGGGPRVTIFSVTPVGVRLRANFFGIDDPNFRGGARTAVGDLNGDGHADLAVAAGFAGGPRVSVYDGRFVLSGLLSRLTSDFFAFDPSLRNGVYLSIGDVNGDGFGDLVIGAGSGGAPEVRVLSGKTLITGGGPPSALAAPLADFFVKGDTTSRGGVRVATKDVDGDGKADVIVGSGEDVPSYVRVYSGSTLNGSGEPAPLQTLDPFGGVVLSEGVFVG